MSGPPLFHVSLQLTWAEKSHNAVDGYQACGFAVLASLRDTGSKSSLCAEPQRPAKTKTAQWSRTVCGWFHSALTLTDP